MKNVVSFATGWYFWIPDEGWIGPYKSSELAHAERQMYIMQLID